MTRTPPLPPLQAPASPVSAASASWRHSSGALRCHLCGQDNTENVGLRDMGAKREGRLKTNFEIRFSILPFPPF
ncbi:hypothetical protein DPMN_109775 [Dreissena polymorpha]|uniref:Uncharacterized protein n=1 Tax=Dreissena polymorpha TaxID=45954 RepID=A0A9D4KAV7_DREPO|nr:hypothetical protein DPMN_109775 [Dreissena polymorpha]